MVLHTESGLEVNSKMKETLDTRFKVNNVGKFNPGNLYNSSLVS